jgi:hypothetical protein
VVEEQIRRQDGVKYSYPAEFQLLQCPQDMDLCDSVDTRAVTQYLTFQL